MRKVLESCDVQVDYLDADAVHCCRVSAHQEGFALYFDQEQRLATVFMYVLPQDGYRSIEPELIAAPRLDSFREAESFFLGEGWAYFASPAKAWIECKNHNCIIHYEFTADGRLGLITLTGASDA